MKKHVLPLLFVTFCCANLFGQKRAMTTDDGLNLSSLSSAMISPDGQSIIYRVDTLDWKKNKRAGNYYFTSSDGQTSFQYLGSQGGSSLQYSPNGTYLSLKRTVDKKQQIFLSDSERFCSLKTQKSAIYNTP